MPLAFDRIRFLVPDSVISRPVDGITVVVDVATGRSFTLDEVGTRVWELLTTMPSAQAAYETLLQEFDAFESDAQARKNIVQAVESVAERLGNTKAVCRKCYIHPAVFDAYLDGSMPPAAGPRGRRSTRDAGSLSEGEVAVLGLLERRAREARRRAS